MRYLAYTVRIPKYVRIPNQVVIKMIDEVFWIQVKASWSQKCDVKLAGKEKIEEDSPSEDLIDDMMDFKL